MQELKQETRKLFLDCKQLHIRKGEDIRLTPYKHKKSFEFECVLKCAYVCVCVSGWHSYDCMKKFYLFHEIDLSLEIRPLYVWSALE